MKRKIQRKILTFVMVLAFAVSVPMQGVQAEEMTNENVNSVIIVTDQEGYEVLSVRPRTTMFDCEIIMAFKTEGLVMTFTTACYGTASVIGVKDIKVQQKMWYGWKTVFTSDGAENQNDNIFAGDLTYSGAEKGKTYRVLCTHYACVDVYEEVEADSGSFKFIY